MKKLLLGLAALVAMSASVEAQVKQNTATQTTATKAAATQTTAPQTTVNRVATASYGPLRLLKKYRSDWSRDMLTGVNKPNGLFYRMREEKQTDLPPSPEEERDLVLMIAEKTEFGWQALWRTPLIDTNYEFLVVHYDEEKNPTATYNLCELTETHNCEVQDIRWDTKAKCLYFNMACPSYAKLIGGKGSKLYCYEPGMGMKWQTPYLTSNDIFIHNDKYVFCAYGFTNERDYLFALNKETGKILSKIPMRAAVEYMEIQVQPDGREVLYVVDYNEQLYTFSIK